VYECLTTSGEGVAPPTTPIWVQSFVRLCQHQSCHSHTHDANDIGNDGENRFSSLPPCTCAFPCCVPNGVTLSSLSSHTRSGNFDGATDPPIACPCARHVSDLPVTPFASNSSISGMNGHSHVAPTPASSSSHTGLLLEVSDSHQCTLLASLLTQLLSSIIEGDGQFVYDISHQLFNALLDQLMATYTISRDIPLTALTSLLDTCAAPIALHDRLINVTLSLLHGRRIPLTNSESDHNNMIFDRGERFDRAMACWIRTLFDILPISSLRAHVQSLMIVIRHNLSSSLICMELKIALCDVFAALITSYPATRAYIDCLPMMDTKHDTLSIGGSSSGHMDSNIQSSMISCWRHALSITSPYILSLNTFKYTTLPPPIAARIVSDQQHNDTNRHGNDAPTSSGGKRRRVGESRDTFGISPSSSPSPGALPTTTSSGPLEEFVVARMWPTLHLILDRARQPVPVLSTLTLSSSPSSSINIPAILLSHVRYLDIALRICLPWYNSNAIATSASRRGGTGASQTGSDTKTPRRSTPSASIATPHRTVATDSDNNDAYNGDLIMDGNACVTLLLESLSSWVGMVSDTIRGSNSSGSSSLGPIPRSSWWPLILLLLQLTEEVLRYVPGNSQEMTLMRKPLLILISMPWHKDTKPNESKHTNTQVGTPLSMGSVRDESDYPTILCITCVRLLSSIPAIELSWENDLWVLMLQDNNAYMTAAAILVLPTLIARIPLEHRKKICDQVMKNIR
jgi:hypothetical protein